MRAEKAAVQQDTSPLPTSVAIIMDGNGRWATARGLSRSEGHAHGARVIPEVLRTLFELDVRYLTLYAFSTENWKRPKKEVNYIFSLLASQLDSIAEDEKILHGCSLRFIGDMEPLPRRLREKCAEIEQNTAGRPYLCTVALNYGGRSEIVHAVNRLLADTPPSVSEEVLSKYMQTYPAPDPDLIIRTGGEARLSNFLLWQSAYSELVVLNRLWPDVRREDILDALEEYKSRRRRFGGI